MPAFSVSRGWRCGASLILVGGLLGAGCGSGSRSSGVPSGGADAPDAAGGSSGADSEAPGTLPNLSTDPDETAEPNPEPEPPDCEVQALTACVTRALDELSSCLAAGHGGVFGEDTSRCDLAEADAVVTFGSAVPRWSTAFALSFVLDVAGQRCASYAERSTGQGVPAGIELVTRQHQVTLETASDSTRTLTCDGVSVGFQQSNLSRCRESQQMPTPELTDQTLDGVYRVSPMLQSNQSVFNCRFAANTP